MNISRLFVLRPVATALLMLALVLVGLVAVRFLPVSSLPAVDYPVIQVQTFYPGASPTVMASTVTAPLEVQLGEIPGLQQMTSNSSAGASVITLQFDLSVSLDVAEQNVQEAINAANSLLPTGLPAPSTCPKAGLWRGKMAGGHSTPGPAARPGPLPRRGPTQSSPRRPSRSFPWRPPHRPGRGRKPRTWPTTAWVQRSPKYPVSAWWSP